MLSGLMQTLAGASGLSWLKVLPWALVGIGVAVSGAGAFGYHEGAKFTAAGYEAEKSAAAEVSAQAALESLKNATQIGLNIVSSATQYVSELNMTRMRRAEIVKKVTADAKANIAATCVVPPTTVGLRQQQVEESAAAYAQDRPM